MVTPALERLIEDFEGDLARLDATRRQIAARAAAEAADPADGVAEPVEEPPASAVQPFVLEDPDRVADVRDAETPDELRSALAPLVDELITRPRFFDLERGWKDEALPRLEARLDTAASALPRLRSRFPEARNQWQELAGSLTGLAAAARDLRFEPPSRSDWWILADDPELELGLTPATRDEIRRPRPLTELEAAADRSVESYSEIVGKVAQAKRELGDPPAGPFAWLDMTAVAMFPLLIGLVLGGATTWRSQRLRELGFTVRLAIEHGGPPGLAPWFWSQAQWNTSAGRAAASAWRACVIQTLTGYFLAMSWIALAAVQLRQLDAADRQRLMIYSIAGASIVLIAVVHRLLVAHGAILALDDADVAYRDRDDVAATGELAAGESGVIANEVEERRSSAAGAGAGDPERDDEILEVRPLRR